MFRDSISYLISLGFILYLFINSLFSSIFIFEFISLIGRYFCGLRRVQASTLVDTILPPLVDIDYKNNVIAETANPMHRRHSNNERAQVVNYGVQKSIH